MHRPRVVVVAQAFKESFAAPEVAAAWERGVRAAGADPIVMLGSDGGDGLLDALYPQLLRRTSVSAEDPLGRLIPVPVGWLDPTTAVVETRLVCGLGLLSSEERQPLLTSTRGVGTIVRRVADAGAVQVYLGLGGSATVDGGLGMARAWGWEALDASGATVPEGGGHLVELATLRAGRPPPVALIGLADVTNPLTGDRGARVYARQKGASPEAVERLAEGLERLATVAGATRPAGAAWRPGAGAAGGLGFGVLQFGQGTLVSGAEWVLDRLALARALSGASAVLVGEGSFDRTSLEGKLTGVVIRRARAAGVPIVLVTPRAEGAPADVVLESGESPWNLAELEHRATVTIRRVLRLLAP